MRSIGLCFAWAGFLTVPMLIIRVAGLTVSDWLFLAAGTLAAVEVLRTRSVPRLDLLAPVFLCSSLYFAAAVLSSVNQATSSAIEGQVTAAKFFYLTSIWFAVCLTLFRNESSVRTAIGFWILGAATSGFAAMAQVLIDPGVVPGSESIGGRSTGLTSHPNDLGASLATALIPCLGLAFLSAAPVVKRLPYAIAALPIGGGLLASASVSSVISAVTALLAMLIMSRKLRLAFVFSFVVLVILSGAYLLLQAYDIDIETISTLYSLTEGEGAKLNTAGSRFDSVLIALQRIEIDPWLGVGMSAGGTVTPIGVAVHNAYLGAWYEGGITGLVALLLMTGYLVAVNRAALRLYQQLDESRVLIISLISAQVAFFVYSLASPGLVQRYGWVAVCLALCVAMLARSRERSSPSTPALQNGAIDG